jgi:2-amino-4-hydroxy-6-hydroxymethyldihydropteridine diphosphokinase
LSAAIKAKAYVSLGSNIEPQKNMPAAIDALKMEFGGILARSSIWQTPAVGSDGPDFHNAVVLIETSLSPEELKHNIFRPLEARMGRVREADKNAPRTIDLDVLIYNDKLLEEELWGQAHLAVPLAEVYPGFRNEDTGETIEKVAGEVERNNQIVKWRG